MNELDPQQEAERAWANYLAWASARKYRSIRRRSNRFFAIMAVALGSLNVTVAVANIGIGIRAGQWISYLAAAVSLTFAVVCFRLAFKWLRQTD